MKFQSNAIFNGTITANSVADAGTNTDKFLVLNSSGVVTYRTAAELYADLGIGSLPAGYTSTLKHAVKAGVALTKGQAVYVTSADGTNMIVGKASNASEATSSKTLGLIESSLSNNGIGNVITEGLLAGLDTTGANAAGDPVWLGTDGNLVYGLLNKPSAPAHMVFIGIVTRVNANNGEIFVKVQNGFEMGELHNYAENGVANNDVIVWENSTSLYKPKSIATILGYTPVTSARTLTINGVSYDLSADRSWTVEGGGGGTSASTRVVQKYTADGTTATYTVTGGYTVGMVDVYVNGIKLDNASGVEFTATNGSTVVLVSTPASGDIVEVYKYGSQFIANNALRQITPFTATAGQTVFTVSYSVGYVDVFYNGSKLAASEYTATNGTSITLGTACVLNDIVEVVAYSYTVGAFTGVGGSGTTNYLPKFTGASTIGDSNLINDASGNLGLGVTPNAWTAYGPILQIGDVGSLVSASGEIGISSNWYYNSGNKYITTGLASFYQQTSGKHRWYNAPSGTAGAGLTFTEAMTLDASGNLGINSNSPLSRLEVRGSGGSTGVTLTLANGGGISALNDPLGIINFYSNDPSAGASGIHGSMSLRNEFNGSWDGTISRQNTYMNFSTAASGVVTEKVRIGSNGNVEIGTSGIGYKLAVYTTGANANLARFRTIDSSNNPYFDVRASGNGIFLDANGSTQGTLYLGTAGNIRFTLDGNGQVFIPAISSGAGTYAMKWTSSTGKLTYDTSSERYKDNIRDSIYGLDSVLVLESKMFEYKDDNRTDIGLIAEEVYKVIPELVALDNDGLPNGVSYDRFVSVLVKAIQEQQQQIDDLKKLIN